ncbi:MAG: PQQ-binding-like beta-propeller repeat protein [Myxococcota bacterium]
MKRALLMVSLVVTPELLHAASSSWPMMGGASSHAGSSTFLGPDTATQAWRANVSGKAGGAVVDVDGSVFIGTANGHVWALEPNGTVRWSVRNLSTAVGVPAVVGNGLVVAGTSAGTMYAWNARTGAPAWTFKANAPITAAVTVGPGPRIHVATRSKGLLVVNADGVLQWQANVGPMNGSSPTVDAEGNVYVGTSDGRVVALSATGTLRWQRVLARSSTTEGTAVLHAGTLYVGGTDGVMHSVVAATGATRWTLPLGAAISAVAVRDDGLIVVATVDGRVRALSDGNSSAQVVWTRALGAALASVPVADRAGHVYVGADNGVHALDGATGAPRWSFPTRGAVRSALALGLGGRLLAGAEDGFLYAIGELRSGSECWSNALVDPAGLPEEEATRRLQVLLAACGGPSVSTCEAIVVGSANTDRLGAAYALSTHTMEPAEYLGILRDRTRKLDALRNDDVAMCAVAAADDDGDLVANAFDLCPDTPPLTMTTSDGCPDGTLPEAPSASLVWQFLDQYGFGVDPHCGGTVPITPVHQSVTTGTVTPQGGGAFREFVTLGVDAPDNQLPGCGTWYEFQFFVRLDDGTIQTHYLVVPRSRGVTSSSVPGVLFFRFQHDDPSPYSDFVASSAFAAPTSVRIRATSFAGYRSTWSSL